MTQPASNLPALYWDDVAEGQDLPGFSYELGLLRLVAYVRATGLYDFVHFDRDYARTVGAEDAFISTFHLAGLFSRLVTDWAGPGTVLRQLTFSMAAQMQAGDMMEFSARTGQKSVSPDGEHWLEIADINVATPRTPHAARASAIVAMPARDGTVPLVSRQRDLSGGGSPNPEMPDWARAMMGEVKPGKAQPHLPLSWQELHLWCEALEDWNPLYWDADYAAQSPYGGLIGSPPSMFYGVASSFEFGIGQGKPGAYVPEPVKRGLVGAELRAETCRAGGRSLRAARLQRCGGDAGPVRFLCAASAWRCDPFRTAPDRLQRAAPDPAGRGLFPHRGRCPFQPAR